MITLKRMRVTSGILAVALFAVLSTSCDKEDEPINNEKQGNQTTPEEDSPTITVTLPSGQTGIASFGQNSDKMQIYVTANFSADYELRVSGNSDWLYVDKANGSLVANQSKTVTLYANRRGMDAGTRNCTLIVSTNKTNKEIPVSVDITEFAPFGSYRQASSCDSRLNVEFRGCYKKDGYVTLTYRITNNGDDIRGLKLWSHPNYSYFNDNGIRYDKDNGNMTSVFGSQSGNGDLTTPVRNGETINCSHTFHIGTNLPSNALSAHLMIYNYGTGDWQCSGKYIDFYDLECEDLDNFDPNYRPTPPPTPEPDPQLSVATTSLDFSTDLTKQSLSISADRDVHYQVSVDKSWLVPSQNEGDINGGEATQLTFHVNRFNIASGNHNATVTISTPFQTIEIPVTMTITEFKTYGNCEDITPCDYRLPVTFLGCYKSGNNVTIMYSVKNNSGVNISGFKLWQHTTYTYFVDNLGNRYNKDTGLYSALGSQSGTGDLMTPIANGETITCYFILSNVNSQATSITTAVAGLYNYGTGDFQCEQKSVIFSNITWTNLDTLFDD